MIPLDGLYRKTRSHSIRATPPFPTKSSLLTKEESFHTPLPLNKKRKYIGTNEIKTKSIKSSSKKKALQREREEMKTRLGYVHPTPAKDVQINEQEFQQHKVSLIYKLIRQTTGTLGGNGAGGAIYGEITQNSFQKIINFLKENCQLSSDSLFLDIGSGLGKPNFHAAVDPSVAISYGIELETLRWQLSLHNLRSALLGNKDIADRSRVMFIEGDITDCQTLDPFSHVYSFDVGFPPKVMKEIAKRFNKSDVQYFINFHAPKKMQGVYGFLVEEIGRVSTQMHGSSEGHTCYFYEKIGYKSKNISIQSREHKEDEKIKEKDDCKRNLSIFGYKLGDYTKESRSYRKDDIKKSKAKRIDPLFVNGFCLLKQGQHGILKWIDNYFYTEKRNGRTRRQKILNSNAVKKEKPLPLYYLPLKTEYYQPEDYI